jgi:hypothetical protein
MEAMEDVEQGGLFWLGHALPHRCHHRGSPKTELSMALQSLHGWRREPSPNATIENMEDVE